MHAFQRYLLWKHFQPAVNNIRVCEFPKSGGTWLSQMLSEVLELPYPRNNRLPFSQCIQHEHFIGPTDYKTIVLVRDGRDVMVSAYFHFLIAEHNRPPHLLKKWRGLMNVEDINNVQKHLPKFIEVFSKNYKVASRPIDWASHINSHIISKKVLIIKYEDLLLNAELELEKIINWYNLKPKRDYASVAQEFSFQNQTKRLPGQENNQSFLRKGIAGDWKNYFNDDALYVFNRLSKDTLIQLGYES